MSDLTATNCGCSNSCNRSSNGCGCMWIILLLLFCGNGCGNGISGLSGDGCGNSSCDWLIWILLISCFCGNNNSGC